MTALHVGQEVVCIHEPQTSKFKEAHPIELRHYTIREIESFPQGDGVRLVEIVNPVHVYRYGTAECAWGVGCFAPVEKKSIAVFRAMCISNKPLVPVE